MSKTPRTDALEGELKRLGYTHANDQMTKLAWQLETELTAAKEKIAEQEAQIKALREDKEIALSLGDQLADWINLAGPAIKNLMDAYERRIRSECKTTDELEKRPWECAEWLRAEKVCKDKPVAVFEIDAIDLKQFERGEAEHSYAEPYDSATELQALSMAQAEAGGKMSKTPITDKNTVGYPQGEFVPARISKELETQLTAAKEKIAEQEAQIKALCEESERLDWVIDNCIEPPWGMFWYANNDKYSYRMKSRSAIDAARKK